MKNGLNVVVAIVMVARIGGVVLAQSGNHLFQQALVKERTEGNLPEAIKLYQRIVQKYSSDHKLAAKALFQIGQAYEKLGNAEARKAYERIARDFADQRDVAADAGRRLRALTSGAAHSPDMLTVHRICADCGDRQASISVDGTRMTFTDWESGDIAIRDMSSGKLTRLNAKTGSFNDSDEYCESPVLSPDNREVAYLWSDGKKDGKVQLRTISATPGSTSFVLVDNPELSYVLPVAWSPDNKSILVTISRPDRTFELAWVSVPNGTINRIKSLNWRLYDPTVSLSSDGRYIAYDALPSNPSKYPPVGPDLADIHIYVLTADGQSETEVVRTAAVNRAPRWTPDGAHIIFTSNLTGKSDLWSVPWNGKESGTPSLVKRDVGQIYPIGMTRSGSYYYTQSNTGVEEVSIAQLSTGGGSRIVESFVGTGPSWSPDGKSVGFKRHSTQSEDSYYAVVRSVETGQETAISGNTLRADPPRWFHDGKKFLTLVGSDVTTQWWHLIDLKKTTFNQTTPRGSFRSGIASLSPDDKTLYIPAREPGNNSNIWDRIVAVDLASGKERLVFRLPETLETLPRGTGITLSPDGRTLALAITNPTTRETLLARVGIDGSDYRELYGPYRADAVFDKLVWTKVGGSIVFSTSAEGKNASKIMRIGSEGGNPEFTGLTIDDLSTFDISPDGSRIAFSTTATRIVNEMFAIDNLSALLKNPK
jgi:Tol biopolymer transport system component